MCATAYPSPSTTSCTSSAMSRTLLTGPRRGPSAERARRAGTRARARAPRMAYSRMRREARGSRPRCGRPAESFHLGAGQPPVGTGREVAELERAEAHALERPHRMADRRAHAPDLALSALVDGQLERVRPH